MSKEVKLSNGMIAIVDDEDFERVSEYTWHWHKQRDSSSRVVTTYKNNGKTVYLPLSRLIMNARKGEVIDHKDRNRLNNTRANLRRCTPSQNQWNRGPDRDRLEVSSKYKGVTFIRNTKRNPYQAQIVAHRKTYYLGSYPSPEIAAFAYDIAAQILHGDFAYLNFPGKSNVSVAEIKEYLQDEREQPAR